VKACLSTRAVCLPRCSPLLPVLQTRAVSEGALPLLTLLAGRRSVQMPSTTQFTYFFSLFAAGLVFLALAFTVFLPVIILAPAKFALCFTLGSALCMAAFLTLKGWRTQLGHMFSAERLPFSVGAPSSSQGTLGAWDKPGAGCLSHELAGALVQVMSAVCVVKAIACEFAKSTHWSAKPS